jgi:hypothetical protein
MSDLAARRTAKWIRALREWNARREGAWCIPRRGTDGYNEVRAIMGEKPIEPPKFEKVLRAKAQQQLEGMRARQQEIRDNIKTIEDGGTVYEFNKPQSKARLPYYRQTLKDYDRYIKDLLDDESKYKQVRIKKAASPPAKSAPAYEKKEESPEEIVREYNERLKREEEQRQFEEELDKRFGKTKKGGAKVYCGTKTPPAGAQRGSPFACFRKGVGVGIAMPKRGPTAEQLQNMNLRQLGALAAERGVKGYSRMRKDQLIEVLTG